MMDASVYTRRSDRPRHIAVRSIKERKPEVSATPSVELNVLSVDKYTECHVTPVEVGRRMASYLGTVSGSLLEPEGGTGNLVAAALDAGWNSEQVTVVERHVDLAEFMRKRFSSENLSIYNSCFIEFASDYEGRFSAILMNPPFTKVYKHINSALKLLAEGGVIVALVPITFDFPGFVEVESLDDDTFSHAKVKTKIVKYQG